MRPDQPRAVVAVALLGFLTAGCVATVAVPEPAPTGTAATVCAAVVADLPATVLGRKQRKVEPGPLTAAWGEPPIVLSCGVPRPSSLTNSSECLEVNGVGWYAEPAQNGTIFTTIGRPAFVELRVPDQYAPATNALVDVSATITAHDPATTPCA